MQNKKDSQVEIILVQLYLENWWLWVSQYDENIGGISVCKNQTGEKAGLIKSSNMYILSYWEQNKQWINIKLNTKKKGELKTWSHEQEKWAKFKNKFYKETHIPLTTNRRM